MSFISDADKSAPLLASSTSFFTIFAKETPKYYTRLLGLNIKRIGLSILSRLHITHPNDTTLKHLDYKIFHNVQKALSISKRFKYRKFLLDITRNLPALKLMRTGADVAAGEVYKKMLFDKMQEDLLKEGSYTPTRIKNLRFNHYVEQKSLFALPSPIKTAEGGVCFSMVMALAKKKLIENQSWVTAVKQYSKGGDKEVSGFQALSEAHFDPNHASWTSLYRPTHWTPMDALASLTGISSNPVSLKENKLLGESPTEKEQIEQIAKLSPGIYSITLRTEDEAHIILLHIEDGNAFIVDPNIGLLRCLKTELQELLCMILSDYPTPRPTWISRALESRNDHHLEVNKLSAVPTHWEDRVSGQTPISLVPTSDAGSSTSKAGS